MIRPEHKLMAVFAYVDDTIQALKRLKTEKSVTVQAVYAPAHNEELIEAVEPRPSLVRWIVLCGGITGILTGLGLAIYTASQWKFIVSGKPPVPLVPYVIPAFEFCILLSVLSGLVGLMLLARMPRFRVPAHFDARFTVDRYGILLACPAALIDRVTGVLRDNGAEEVRDARL